MLGATAQEGHPDADPAGHARAGPGHGVGALILLVVVTQVVTAFGSGAWFPYAVPGLWMGMGGAGAAETVNALQLLLCVPVSIVGGAITGHGWQTMQISRG